MLSLAPSTVAIVGMLVALWLVAAVWATVAGVRRALAAQGAQAEAERLGALVVDAPAIPLIVAADGRIDPDARLLGWLGLARAPRFVADLAQPDGGLEPEDAAALARETLAVQRAGRPASLAVHVRGSARVLQVRGQPTRAAGEVVLWFFDATESRQEIERLEGEARRIGGALEAISALIEAAPFPMWHRGPDLRLSLVNSAYVRAVEGRDAADVVARGLELVEGIAGRGPLAAAAAAAESGRIAVNTLPATIGGERRTVKIVDVPLGPSGVAGYAIDVEELEEARADLARFGRSQRDTLDRLSSGVAQFAADRSLIFFNRPFVRQSGLQPDWLADAPEFDRVLDAMRQAQRLPESRDYPGWKAERRGWFTATEGAEESWLLPNGMHLRVVAQPLPDGGLLTIFEDRTEQVQLASARDTLLRVRTATFDNLFEAVSVFAADGRLHLWNNRFKDVWELRDAELDAHPRVDALAELIGRRLANPSQAGLIRELVRVATVERRQRSGRVTLSDGRHFEFAAVPLPDGNALFTMLDITASRQMEAALRERNEALVEADRLKTAFLANVSYELRVPLTSIQGFAEMLSAGFAGALSDTGRDYVDAILSSVARLGTLIEDVLDLTQSAAGSLPLAEERIELGKLAREAADAVRPAAVEKGLEFEVQVERGAGKLSGDPRRLRQAIDHLLRNAVAYTPAGGRVLLRAAGTRDEAEIVVSDNGDGIDPKERDRVFDRFHRASDERTVGPDGRPALGLGLPLARQFVEAHGGTLTLLTERGEGTAAIIRLPRKRVG